MLKYTIIHHFQVGADIANQKSYHDEKSIKQCFTGVFCPRVVGILTVLLLLPTQYTAGEIVKMWCQEFDIYLLANIYTYMYRYRYHPLDKRYGFSISVQPEIASLLICCFYIVKKNVFQKLASLWLVGEVFIHVGLYGSKVAEGCSAFQHRSC